MGMYTEILIKANIELNVSEEVDNVLQHLFNSCELDENIKLPKHKFFTLRSWGSIGRSSSYYHHPEAISSLQGTNEEGYYLFSRSDLKNCHNEIEEFFDWVMPYINESEGKCVGYSWYEENDKPILICKQGVINLYRLDFITECN